MNLDELINSMTPEQIRAVMSKIASNGPTRVAHTRKAKRIAKTELYFKSAPLPYRSTYEEYKQHAEGVRQQVLSGVDL